MADEDDRQLKRTPLYEEHVRLNAKIVPFGGFAMPVQYPTGIRAEHRAVRQGVGVFDLSHMGELRVRGADAEAFVAYLATNDPTVLTPGRAQYTVMCNDDGGAVDDLVAYRLGEEDFRLVVNAANIEKDREHVRSLTDGFDVEVEDESEEVALIAVQGPDAQAALQPVADVELDPIGFYRFDEGRVAGADAVVSRTGYTGEDGFEVYVDAADAPSVWRRVLEAGEPLDATPAGLGARDTLRLEMGYALYGHELDEETTPLEAGLGWLVKLERGDFVGREALLRQKEEGPGRRLTGFRLVERGFPREGYDVVYRGERAAEVRSGTVSPSLGYGIGTVFLPPDAEAGDPLAVVIRGEEKEGVVEPPPFYREGSLRR